MCLWPWMVPLPACWGHAGIPARRAAPTSPGAPGTIQGPTCQLTCIFSRLLNSTKILKHAVTCSQLAFTEKALQVLRSLLHGPEIVMAVLIRASAGSSRLMASAMAQSHGLL